MKRRARRYLAGAALVPLLAGALEWCGASRAPDEGGREGPHIFAEPARPALRIAGAAPAAFIRAIEVTRPRSVELTVTAPLEPRQPLPVEVEEVPPVCDAAPRALLRAGCPAAPPAVEACGVEGQECRYGTPDACTAHYECLYGLWSPLGVTCPDAQPGRLLSGAGQCEANTPVPDSPCSDEGASCGHQPCGVGEFTQILAECRCGRWYQRRQQCPLTR